MKKIILIVTIVATVAVAAVLLVLNLPKTIYATDIVIYKNKIVLQVGEQYTLSNNDFKVEPNGFTERSVFSSTNESIASVDIYTGIITANTTGECEIVITAKSAQSQTISKKLQLEVIDKKFYPSQVQIDVDSVQIYINQSFKLNTIITGTTNVLPSVVSQNGCVVYNFNTDSITGIKPGTDKLTITYLLLNGTSKVFEIDVVVSPKHICSQNVTIDMQQDVYMHLSYHTQSLRADCVATIVTGADCAQIAEHEFKYICIVAQKRGSCTLVVDSPTSTCTFYITIV